MSILRKLNPDATDKNFNFTRHESGCCPQDQICAYKVEFVIGASVEAVTFLNSKGMSTVHTFATPYTTAETLEAGLKTLYTTIEDEKGFGAVAVGVDGLMVEDGATNTVVTIATDVVISSFTVAGAAVVATVDCTTAKVCACQFVVNVDENVGALLLAFNGATATLATGTYSTGAVAAAALKADVETALTTLTVENTGVTVEENVNEGLFLVSVKVVGDCSSVTWNNSELLNCGCKQSYLFEV